MTAAGSANARLRSKASGASAYHPPPPPPPPPPPEKPPPPLPELEPGATDADAAAVAIDAPSAVENPAAPRRLNDEPEYQSGV